LGEEDELVHVLFADALDQAGDDARRTSDSIVIAFVG